MTPRVSIGMPVRNGAAHIAEALDALLAQSMGDFELLISDNASTDATADIVFCYAARELRIRNWRQPDDIGAVANFNAVLARAEAPLFMWAAADDLWHADFLARLVPLLTARPDASMAAPGIVYCDSFGTPQLRYDELAVLGERPWMDQLRAFLDFPGVPGEANLIYSLMRRDMLVRAGGFAIWSSGTYALDALVVLKLLTLGPLVTIPDTLFYKRASPPNDGDGILQYTEAWQRIIAEAETIDAATKASLMTLNAIR